MYRIGMKVTIVDAAGHSVGRYKARNPKPQHIGKRGKIVREEKFAGNLRIPVIRLSDGTILRGYECWWTPGWLKEKAEAAQEARK